ncbi:DUF4181 domain-containing protein [Clostridium tarantellae]|uniref:DUF4181 domain-containing protein n=1 Tax=Clostridium tarantellae TaxID=39493 RepID=A0A6I1MMC6_9CLOT|nr:DUF4181 domain-containing protein [Clostridium tarantellae]MPQ43392.1 DUF4181 domain-containing protein [Clostridium tarantellae]
MKLIKGKVSFARSLFACFIFPLIFGYFYSYVNKEWFFSNQIIGLVLGISFIFRGTFEKIYAKNQRNAKISFICGSAIIIYVICRFLEIL